MRMRTPSRRSPRALSRLQSVPALSGEPSGARSRVCRQRGIGSATGARAAAKRKRVEPGQPSLLQFVRKAAPLGFVTPTVPLGFVTPTAPLGFVTPAAPLGSVTPTTGPDRAASSRAVATTGGSAAARRGTLLLGDLPRVWRKHPPECDQFASRRMPRAEGMTQQQLHTAHWSSSSLLVSQLINHDPRDLSIHKTQPLTTVHSRRDSRTPQSRDNRINNYRKLKGLRL